MAQSRKASLWFLPPFRNLPWFRQSHKLGDVPPARRILRGLDSSKFLKRNVVIWGPQGSILASERFTALQGPTVLGPISILKALFSFTNKRKLWTRITSKGNGHQWASQLWGKNTEGKGQYQSVTRNCHVCNGDIWLSYVQNTRSNR